MAVVQGDDFQGTAAPGGQAHKEKALFLRPDGHDLIHPFTGELPGADDVAAGPRRELDSPEGQFNAGGLGVFQPEVNGLARLDGDIVPPEHRLGHGLAEITGKLQRIAAFPADIPVKSGDTAIWSGWSYSE